MFRWSFCWWACTPLGTLRTCGIGSPPSHCRVWAFPHRFHRGLLLFGQRWTQLYRNLPPCLRSWWLLQQRSCWTLQCAEPSKEHPCSKNQCIQVVGSALLERMWSLILSSSTCDPRESCWTSWILGFCGKSQRRILNFLTFLGRGTPHFWLGIWIYRIRE